MSVSSLRLFACDVLAVVVFDLFVVLTIVVLVLLLLSLLVMERGVTF